MRTNIIFVVCKRIVLILCFFAICSPVSAIVREYEFEGVRTGGSGPFSSFSGRFVYDSPGFPFYAREDVARFYFSYFEVTFSGSGTQLTYCDTSFTRKNAEVRNVSSEDSDSISFVANNWTSGSSPSITLEFKIKLKDYTKTVFSGDWPIMPESLNLSDFQSRSFTGMDNQWSFNGMITGLTLVPEPSTPLIEIPCTCGQVCAEFDFVCHLGGSNPEPQVLSIRNNGIGELSWRIMEDCNWVEVWPTSGRSSGELDDVFISVDANDFDLGEYTCLVTISDPDALNSPQYVTVNLGVRIPVISAAPKPIHFYAPENGPNPEAQILSVWNGAGAGTLQWQITEDCDWLDVWPTEGNSTGEVEVNEVRLSVDVNGLTMGTYGCNLTIWDLNALNSPYTVPAAFHVLGEIVHVPAQYATIQDAIDHVNIGGTVIVEPYIYTGTGNRDISFRGKAITVRSTDPNDPNIVATTIIDCDANTSDRHRGFVFAGGEDGNSLLAGFTITNGFTTSSGGAIRCVGSSPTITNCTITGNITYGLGGGISCEDGNPTIRNCIITGNTASDPGGGGIGWEGGYLTISNCVISYNESYYKGGGIVCETHPVVEGGLNINNCTFVGNWALRDGGAIEGWGQTRTITNCTFIGNVAGDDGGALSYCTGIISGCIFTGNRAEDVGEGGALYNCSVTMTNCVLSGNWAATSGGGIHHYGSLLGLEVTNCTFSGNSSGGAGGGIYNHQDVGVTVSHCVFWGNTDSSGAGESAQIRGDPPYVSFSCIQDDDPDDANIPFGGADNNNIDDYPMFVRDPDDGGDGWGDYPGTPDVNEGANDDFGDLHLQPGSPCINAGDPFTWYGADAVDMDGQPRIMGYIIDMGADEFFFGVMVVTEPEGGDVWVAGSWHEITWESFGIDGTVDIFYSSNNGSNWITVDNNVANTGEYMWELPAEVDSNQCLVSVVPSGPDPNVVCIESGLFTIQHYPSRPGAPPGQMRKWDNFRRTGLSDTFGPELGCVKWMFETDGLVSASVTVGVDDRVAIACEDGKLYTLDANGVLLWSYDTNSPLISSPVFGYYGMIYVGGENGKLYAIDIDGDLRWTHTTDGFIYSSGAVSADGQVYVCSEDGKLYALGPDGSELWTFELYGSGVIGGSIFASPAVATDGTIYVGGLYDPNLYALDPNDGSVKWACNFGYRHRSSSRRESGWPFASPVIAADGTIYQTLLYDPNLYAIKPNEPNAGTIIWSTNLADSDSGWFGSGYISRHGDVDGWSEPALGPDGTIYVSLNDPYLRAVEPDGSIKWVTRLGMMDGFTLTVGSDGLIYAAGNDGYLCVVDANGYELARFASDSGLRLPVISADNTIIVSDANRVWAIDGCSDAEFVLHRPEDVDASRAVDLVDFALLALDWLACNDPYAPCEALAWDGTYFTGDIDRNLYVNFVDVAAIANRWLSAD